jgi:hypothetical protein
LGRLELLEGRPPAFGALEVADLVLLLLRELDLLIGEIVLDLFFKDNLLEKLSALYNLLDPLLAEGESELMEEGADAGVIVEAGEEVGHGQLLGPAAVCAAEAEAQAVDHAAVGGGGPQDHVLAVVDGLRGLPVQLHLALVHRQPEPEEHLQEWIYLLIQQLKNSSDRSLQGREEHVRALAEVDSAQDVLEAGLDLAVLHVPVEQQLQNLLNALPDLL